MNVCENPIQRASRQVRNANPRAKTWAAERVQFDPGNAVLVTGLCCDQPGCPLLGTVIANLRGGQHPVQTPTHRAAAVLGRSEVPSAGVTVSFDAEKETTS